MNRQNATLILPFVLWVGLLPILSLISWSKGIVWFYAYPILPIYLFGMPLAMVRFIEKESLIKRFGMQPSRLLVLLLLVITSIWATLFMTTADWNAFIGVLIAPITEEMFFRGYILGRYTKGFTSESSRKVVGSLILSSVIFSASHVFRGYSVTDYILGALFGIVIGFAYSLTRSILIPTASHAAWNFSLLVKEFTSSTQLLIAIALIITPSLLLFPIERLTEESNELKRMFQLLDSC